MIEIANMDDLKDLTPIQRFYSNTNIFITGGTGFLGKILIEKLLRSCSNLSTIYVLIRNKKGKNLHQRLDELFDDCIFDRLRLEVPKFRHKIVAVSGDCSLADLGISLQDRQVLINEVSIVFHVAATVRFDEKLKIAVAINVKSTKEILNLFKQMLNKTSLIHVSTAFSHVPNSLIDERFYQSPIDPDKLILLTESLSDQMLDKITPGILGKWPNTYTFTKAIAEDVIRSEGQQLPVGLFRPAIVVSTYKEPIRAWVSNLYGPTGVSAGAGTGVLRTLYCDKNVNANIVPVDMCVNSMITTAWDVAQIYQNNQKFNLPYDIQIYNYESSNDQPITWGEFMRLSEKYGLVAPSIKAIWYYCLTIQSNYFLYLLATIFLHYLPALIVDGTLICIGRPPRMLKIYKKIHKFSSVISYFCVRTWVFRSDRVRQLLKKMADKDRDLFFFDMSKLNWEEFFQLYIHGIRIYMIQDPLDTLNNAKIKWKRLYWCHQFVKIIVGLIVFRLILWLFSMFYL